MSGQLNSALTGLMSLMFIATHLLQLSLAVIEQYCLFTLKRPRVDAGVLLRSKMVLPLRRFGIRGTLWQQDRLDWLSVDGMQVDSIVNYYLQTLFQLQFRFRQSPSRAILKMLVPASVWQEGRLPLSRELGKKMATLCFTTLG